MWICSDDKSDLTWIQIPWKFSLDLEFPMAMRPSMGNLQLEISTWGKFTAKTMVFRCDFPNKTNSLWTLRCTNFWFVYIYTVYKYIYIHVYIYIYKKCVFYMYINPSFSWVSSRFFLCYSHSLSDRGPNIRWSRRKSINFYSPRSCPQPRWEDHLQQAGWIFSGLVTVVLST